MVVLSSGPLRAEPIDWSAVHRETMAGIDQLYNMNIDSAERTFHHVTVLAPGDPRGYFFLSMISFYRYNLEGNEFDLNRFLSLSDTVIGVCEHLIDQDDNNAQAHFFLGGIYGYRGLAHQRNGSMMKAVNDGRKGYASLEDALDKDSTLYDAYMGLGVFRYYLAKAPRSLSWILKVLGFGGDIKEGIASVRLAATRGTYSRVEATYFLAQFLFNEHQDDEAFHLMDLLTEKYPDNTLFLVLEAEWYRRRSMLSKAYALARKALAIQQSKNLKFAGEFTYSTLAGIQFTLNDFLGAQDSYRIYMATVSNKAFVTNFVLYRSGLSEEIVGNRTRARELYHMAKTPADKNNEFEGYYLHRCQALDEHPLSPAESLLVSGSNEMSQEHYEAAKVQLEYALGCVGMDTNLQSRILYALQLTLFELSQFQNSVSAGQKAIACLPTRETWVPPHAWFKIGQAEAKLGETEEARAAFRRVDNYDGYDYQNRLESQTEDELKRLP